MGEEATHLARALLQTICPCLCSGQMTGRKAAGRMAAGSRQPEQKDKGQWRQLKPALAIGNVAKVLCQPDTHRHIEQLPCRQTHILQNTLLH